MSDDRLRSLMQELYDAHREFRAKWDKWWNGGGKQPEPETVKNTRDRFWAALNRLFGERLEPLYSAFASDPVGAADAVIDFLEIDIPAFRCGYVKEKFLRRLKSITLTDSQQARLKRAALGLVSNGAFRREFGDWSRLMIVLADDEFVAALRDFTESIEAGTARGAERMLKVVLENRPDLGTNA